MSSHFGTIIAIVIFLLIFLFIVLPFALDRAGIHIFPGTIPAPGGIIMSTDQGRTWKNAAIAEQANQVFPARIFDIAAHPRDSDILFLGTSSGLWKSVNGGGSWVRVHDAKGILNIPTTVSRIVPSDQNPQLMYLAVFQNLRGRVLRSQDGGISFEEVFATAGQNLGVWDIALIPADPGHAFIATQEGSVYETQNAGETWRIMGRLGKPVQHITVNPFDPRNVYAVLQDGSIVRTADGGQNWSILPSPVPAQHTTQVKQDPVSGENPFNPLNLFKTTSLGPYTLAPVPGNFNELYFATPSGLFRSADSGAHWEAVNTLVPPKSVPLTFVQIPQDNPGQILAAASNHVYESTDNGATWHVQEIPTTLPVKQLLIQPKKDTRMFIILGQ